MKTKIRFRDGFEVDEYTNDNYYDIINSICIDLAEVPQMRTAISREELVKSIVQHGKVDSVIEGMYSIEGVSEDLGCSWIISTGRAEDVKYEDVVNSGYTFKYFTISDGTVYVLFSSTEDL